MRWFAGNARQPPLGPKDQRGTTTFLYLRRLFKSILNYRLYSNSSCVIEKSSRAQNYRGLLKTVPRSSQSPAPTLDELASQVRAERDMKIAETDYLAMPDYPLSDEDKAAVMAYRQALRDRRFPS